MGYTSREIIVQKTIRDNPPLLAGLLSSLWNTLYIQVHITGGIYLVLAIPRVYLYNVAVEETEREREREERKKDRKKKERIKGKRKTSEREKGKWRKKLKGR